METIKLSSRGQIVIPKDIREQARLAEGMEFSIVFEGGEIRLRPVPGIQPSTHAEAAGCLYRPGRAAMSAEETEAAIAAMLQSQDDATKS
ncbi:MAG: AbrB/MazE/SpoVT family DNA-binding domain-containing protein [Betaproteobacteria bacterium]|nr:AbrB/MazE/SpoVT family DNA-binding domain-containing protein [Betaproteobacteria bacterium]